MLRTQPLNLSSKSPELRTHFIEMLRRGKQYDKLIYIFPWRNAAGEELENCRILTLSQTWIIISGHPLIYLKSINTIRVILLVLTVGAAK